MHHILQGGGLFIEGQVYFQRMLRESVSIPLCDHLEYVGEEKGERQGYG